MHVEIDPAKLLGASTERQEPYKKYLASYMNILVFVEMFCVCFYSCCLSKGNLAARWITELLKLNCQRSILKSSHLKAQCV